MDLWKLIFWLLLLLVFYTHLGYGLLLFLMVKIKQLFVKRAAPGFEESNLPEVTFIVAAYNEQDYIEDKIRNCLAFNYPKDKIRFWFVTDGSNDRTPELVEKFPVKPGQQIRLFHSPERKGKIAAVERVMAFVETPVTIFTDANTDVNPEAIRNIVRHFADPNVGAVAGEKRIAMGDTDEATGAGEGIYWKYESLLKKWDSDLNSVIGAAGELFAIRTDQYRHVPADTLIEDFVMTMGIAMRGFRLVYEPEAYAVEFERLHRRGNEAKNTHCRRRFADGLALAQPAQSLPLRPAFISIHLPSGTALDAGAAGVAFHFFHQYLPGLRGRASLSNSACPANRFLFFRYPRLSFRTQTTENQGVFYSLLLLPDELRHVSWFFPAGFGPPIGGLGKV
jgi:cellulose synthase/poly-beta-1,6-N-acetylglucosamine synthase-like glycosyltransferase